MLKKLVLALCATFVLSAAAHAQEDYTAKTAADPKISVEELKLHLTPLQVEQLKAEADAWLALVVQQNTAISAKRVEALKAANDEAKAAALDTVNTLREQRTQILDRLDAVLAELVAKGTEEDAAAYRQYISASTGLGLQASDVTDVTTLWTTVYGWLTSKEGGIRLGLNIVKFLLTLLVFKILANILGNIMRRTMMRLKKTSDLLRDFFVNSVRKVTFFIGVIVALSMLEVNIGPFLAALGAAGFVIGFALQGTLSNFASGIMILIYRPYDIGEVVTVAGTTGKVDAMSLVSTTLRLPDNSSVVIPNNSIWGDVITNITGTPTRRVDMVFGVGYGDDLKKAERILMEILKSDPRVLADPEPVVKVGELADSSVNFIVRPWVKTGDYWDVFWDTTRAVKDRFDQEGVSIPFPQRDVHVHQVGVPA